MKFVELSADEFRGYSEKSPYRSFMQTPEIAEYRENNGWTTYYLGVKDARGQLLAATLLVAKPTFLGKSTFIAPGGPLLDFADTRLTTFFLKHLKRYAKTHNGYVLRLSPYFELIARDRDGVPIPGGFNHEHALTLVKNLGFRQISHPDQPQFMFALDLAGRTADELFKSFKSNTRGHIKKAEKMGVTVRELKKEELGILKQITASTAARREFTDKPLSYYQQMYDLFIPRHEAIFLVAEANIGEGPSLTPLSAAMFMLTGSEVVYLFSGSDEKYMKDYNAQYAIQWHMIKYAADHGFKRYNFYGIHALPKNGELDGVYDFKKGFATGADGHVIELIGTLESSVNAPLYYLHHLLSSLKPR